MEKRGFINTRNTVRSIAGLAAAGLMIVSALMPARIFAEEAESEAVPEAVQGTEVIFSTDYPGVTLKPGATGTFTLYLTNAGLSETTVELSDGDLPEGWEGTFKGSSNEVSMVHIGAMQTKKDSPSLSYSLTIPDDTPEDTYTITLNARSDEVDEDLPLIVKVNAEEKILGEGSFSTDYAEQEGTSGTKFSYTTTLTNNSPENQTYALAASGAPEGWTVTFTPSDAGSATSSVPVDAGASTTINVAVTPSQNVEAGDYELDLTASSAAETLDLPVTVRITGSYGLSASTPTGNLAVKTYAGETQDVTLVLQNTGNIDLNNVALSAQASTDWKAEFDRSSIDSIPAGETAEVTLHITPASSSVLGDYVTVVTASSSAVSAECDLRVSVQNHTAWGAVAVAIIAALVLGLALIIRKFGRR
ncbi:MAG: hypothetical protein II640_04180 [Lachnospiraceae bacterium]|nr:hypothetical protein [Lachnospiraceae bacterium]